MAEMPVYQIVEGLAIQEVADEVFVLNRSAAVVHTFNGTGRFCWTLVREGLTAKEIVDRLTETYDISTEQAELDCKEFLAELESSGLIACRSPKIKSDG